MSIGRKQWAIAEGYIPPYSHGPSPQMTSHEAVCILNAGDETAHVEILLFYESRDQVEVISLIGDVALDKGEPKVHAHVVVGKRNGSAMGGHLLAAHVWPTLELVLQDSGEQLKRRFDPESGLALVDLD